MSSTTTGGSLIGKIGSYLQIVAKDPSSTAFVPLAEAYRQVGLLDDALEASRLGTQRLPHFSPGFSTMGRILGQMGRIDEAMSSYAKALSLDRQSQAALVGLARLHLIRAERDQARKILLQAKEFHPNDDKVSDMLNALDLPRPWDNIKQTTVSSEVTGFNDTNPEGDTIPTATLAEIYVKQGHNDKAIKVYRDILVLNPDDLTARNRLRELDPGTEPAERLVQVSEKQSAPDADLAVSPSSGDTKQEKDLSPIAVLQRWLNVIKQGRANV